jgi:Fic family protein
MRRLGDYMYIHERKGWPEFTWNQAMLAGPLAEVRHLQGRLLGRMEALGFLLREEATMETLTQDVIKTSEIEGEKLDLQQVRSSIARRLGLDIGGSDIPAPRNVEGIVEVMLDATRNPESSLLKLVSTIGMQHFSLRDDSGMQRITVGKWRTEASGSMQVVSGQNRS